MLSLKMMTVGLWSTYVIERNHVLYSILAQTHTKQTDLSIGFRDVTYSVSEGVGSLTFEVEIKNGVMAAIPIELEVTDTEGGAVSKFHLLLF